MITVQEYKLPDAPECHLELPADAVMLDVYKRGHQFMLIVMLDTEKPLTPRCVTRVAVAAAVPGNTAYIGSHYPQSLHFFEVLPDAV